MTLDMAREIVPVVKNTPVIGGVCATDPFTNIKRFLQELKEVGVSGVINYPTVCMTDGIFRENLEAQGFSFEIEIKMLKMAYEIASGGVDFLKDDEALVNPKYCPLEERVVKIMDALDKVKEETGKKVLYAFNITMDRHDKMLEAADMVKSHGGNHLMVCWAYLSYGGIRILAEDPSINLPLHVHRCGHGALSRMPDHGIDSVLISKLGRMSGADEMHLGAIEGKFHYSIAEAVRHVSVFRGPWYHFKPTLPTLSAGNHPGNVASSCGVVGNEVLLLAGGGIIGHPISPTAGGKAMIQAAEAYIKGIPVEEYAKDHEELQAAIKFWGVGVSKKITGT